MKKLLTFAFLALAAIPLHRRRRAPLSPFAGTSATAVWNARHLLIVVIVLGKFAWGPVLSLLQEREQFITKSLPTPNTTRRSGSAAEGLRREAAERPDGSRRDHRRSEARRPNGCAKS